MDGEIARESHRISTILRVIDVARDFIAVEITPAADRAAVAVAAVPSAPVDPGESGPS